MRRYLLAIWLAVASPSLPAWAGNLSIEDVPGGARLDADDVPVEQAVDALGQRFKFAVKVVRPSGARLSGSRSGSTQEVLNWVLTGHDRAIFISKVDGQDKVTRVVIYGPAGGTPPPRPRDPQEAGVGSSEYPDAPVEDVPLDSGASEEPKGPPLDGGIGDSGGDGPPDAPAQ